MAADECHWMGKACSWMLCLGAGCTVTSRLLSPNIKCAHAEVPSSGGIVWNWCSPECSPERQSRTPLIALGSVVEHNIHQHLYATPVALFDHGLELLDNILTTPTLGSSLAVPCHRCKEANGGVSPVVVAVVAVCPWNQLRKQYT